MPVEIREILIKAILEQEGDPATAQKTGKLMDDSPRSRSMKPKPKRKPPITERLNLRMPWPRGKPSFANACVASRKCSKTENTVKTHCYGAQ